LGETRRNNAMAVGLVKGGVHSAIGIAEQIWQSAELGRCVDGNLGKGWHGCHVPVAVAATKLGLGAGSEI
jgi:hypothetical protein